MQCPDHLGNRNEEQRRPRTRTLTYSAMIGRQDRGRAAWEWGKGVQWEARSSLSLFSSSVLPSDNESVWYA
jgi:hypothetical protein